MLTMQCKVLASRLVEKSLLATTRRSTTIIKGVFGLRNEVVHLLLTPHFFIWFVEWNRLIHHHLISHKLIISIISVRNELVSPKFIR
jgi:hypothetical protein